MMLLSRFLLPMLAFFTLFAENNMVFAQSRCIHVFVALCDNKNQGIVPVPEKIGNGQNPASNLYWGAGYGVKNFFAKKSPDWQLVQTLKSDNQHILDRLLFKHKTENVYLLADAWDGAYIRNCTEAFLLASNGQNPEVVQYNGAELQFGGNAQLLAYTGHDGLMDFELNPTFKSAPSKKLDVIILACYSRNYFTPHIHNSGANPLLWTTHLMAPEAYTLEAAIRGWILHESPQKIEIRAEEAYNNYQKCGIKGARNLFATGFKKEE
jgi:hypothetical protein